MNEATTSDSKTSPQIIPAPRVPSVFLIVTSPTGEVMGMLGGENPIMADMLRHYAKTAPEKGREPMVVQSETPIFPLGQDIYRVTREFLLHARACLIDMPWSELTKLDRLPTTSYYTFVVSM